MTNSIYKHNARDYASRATAILTVGEVITRADWKMKAEDATDENVAKIKEAYSAMLGAMKLLGVCMMCADRSFLPRHNGSTRCRSGSIASGGTTSHCSCDTCF